MLVVRLECNADADADAAAAVVVADSVCGKQSKQADRHIECKSYSFTLCLSVSPSTRCNSITLCACVWFCKCLSVSFSIVNV